MPGKKEKKQNKKNKSLSHIGTALFPRAMFAAVPRSPEPPKPPTPTGSRPPSALSTAIMDATFVGRAIASPSPNSTLRTTGELSRRVEGPEEAEFQRTVENTSMAHSSMYDYGDSEDEDDDDEDLDIMGTSRNHTSMDYDDPGYARVGDIQDMLAENKRGTISNRARLDTPPMSDDEVNSPMTTDRSGTTSNRLLQDSSELPGTSTKSLSAGHSAQVKGQIEEDPQEDEVDGRKQSGKKKAKKKGKEKKKKKAGKAADTEDDIEALYAQPMKKPVERELSNHSNSSSLTRVTSPTADDFSDLISPPPPWKKNVQSPGREVKDVLSGRSKTSGRTQELVQEPVIQQVKATNIHHAPPTSIHDDDMYSHIDRSQALGSLMEDRLQRTNARLEQELELVKQERDELQGSLEQRTRQLMEERGRSSAQQQQTSQGTSAIRAELRRTTAQNADLQAQVTDLTSMCQRQRDEKRSLQEANKKLRAENQAMLETAEKTNDQEDGVYIKQLKEQAERVIEENEELKNVVHKLNIHLSRYQAKYSSPQKGDPPGLPSRGSTPRWLTDTKYLSPLIAAYEEQLMEKEAEIEANLEDIQELRRNTEEVIRENQRLHTKRLSGGGGGGRRDAALHQSESWLSEMEEQARLVLEENQVVLEQVDLQQRKLQDQQRKHTQETIRLTKQLAALESERSSLEGDLSELQMKYGALKDQHEKTIKERESQMPVEEHMNAVAEYKRSMQDLRRQNEAETETTLSKLTSVEAEKTGVVMRLTSVQAENSQLKGEILALNKANKRLQHQMSLVERELEHSQTRELAANQHLNRVLEIAEQTAAERDSYKKMAKAQSQEKERAVNKMMAGNVAIGRMEEKLRMYKLRAESKVEDVLSQMKDQDELHTSRLTQYDREMKHLSHLVREKQDALDSITADKQKVEEHLEVVWQSAAQDNKRLKAKLARSLRSSSAVDSNLLPFGSDSDNRGLLSSESD
ncbi:uncharacterized protein [Diadema antillarum]|uniref:uncharacterized protein n=1 Tax=Diadema antillarum TaxID=105358 RepID=UPI003A87FFB8